MQQGATECLNYQPLPLVNSLSIAQFSSWSDAAVLAGTGTEAGWLVSWPRDRPRDWMNGRSHY